MVAMLEITKEMRDAAVNLLRNRALKLNGSDRDLLIRICDGSRKRISGHWWEKFFKKIDQAKLNKLQAMADPARNPNAHERMVASRKLDQFKASRAPGMRPESPPITSELFRRKHRKQIGGVNAKPVGAKRTGDRHLSKGDRHKPGYMRDYMRRRRAAARVDR